MVLLSILIIVKELLINKNNTYTHLYIRIDIEHIFIHIYMHIKMNLNLKLYALKDIHI